MHVCVHIHIHIHIHMHVHVHVHVHVHRHMFIYIYIYTAVHVSPTASEPAKGTRRLGHGDRSTEQRFGLGPRLPTGVPLGASKKQIHLRVL